LPPNAKYGISFLLFAGWSFLQATSGGYFLLWLWPGLAFLLVSLAYFGGSPWVFGKRKDGTRHWLSTLLLLPFLMLIHATWSAWAWFTGGPASHRVTDSLIVARRLRAHEYPEGVALIADLTSEMLDPPSIRQLPGYRCFAALDAAPIPPAELLKIVQQLRVAPGEQLLIHCANGHGRTGMVAAAWLIERGEVHSVEEALELLQSKRPTLRLGRSQRAAVEEMVQLRDSSQQLPGESQG